MFVGGRRLGLTVLAALISVGAVGCSGGSDSPQSLPPISTTPAPSQSSAPPLSPKAAAVAVVRRYFRLLNAPTSLATARALRSLMTPNCDCTKVADSTATVARRGQHYFGRTTARDLTPTVDGNVAEVLADYDYTTTGIANGDGSVVSKSPGRTGATLDFRLRRAGDTWRIYALIYVRKGHPA